MEYIKLKLVKICIIAFLPLLALSTNATVSHQLTAISNTQLIIVDKNAVPVLFRGNNCYFLTEAKSKEVGKVDLTVSSVSCDGVERLVPMEKRVTLSLTDANELVKGTAIDGSPWMKFTF